MKAMLLQNSFGDIFVDVPHNETNTARAMQRATHLLREAITDVSQVGVGPSWDISNLLVSIGSGFVRFTLVHRPTGIAVRALWAEVNCEGIGENQSFQMRFLPANSTGEEKREVVAYKDGAFLTAVVKGTRLVRKFPTLPAALLLLHWEIPLHSITCVVCSNYESRLYESKRECGICLPCIERAAIGYGLQLFGPNYRIDRDSAYALAEFLNSACEHRVDDVRQLFGKFIEYTSGQWQARKKENG